MIHDLIHWLDDLRHELISTFGWEPVKTNIGAGVWWAALVAFTTYLLYPKMRKAVDGFMRNHLQHANHELRDRLDHIIMHHPDIPNFNNGGNMTIDDNSLRIPGKRGKQPARHVPSVLLHQFAREGAVAVPETGDVTNGVTSWGMLGNDQYGDCGVAAFEHLCMAKAATNGVYASDFVVPTTQATVDLYFAYGEAQGEGPNADQGVENATWLAWLFKQGLIEGYAEIDVASPGAADRVHAAMNEFGGVLVGVQLTADAEQLFGAHQPWTTENGETPQTNMGHDVALVKYDANGDTFVTWGDLQASTINWDSVCIDEAWVFVTRQDAERAGYDFEALLTALKTLPENQEIATPVAPTPAPAAAEHVNKIHEITKKIEKMVENAVTSEIETLAGGELAVYAKELLIIALEHL